MPVNPEAARLLGLAMNNMGEGQNIVTQIDNSAKTNLVLATATGTQIGTASNQLLGFYGQTAVDQPAGFTAQLTSITHTAPGTPDYALQNLVQNTGFGFATADEGNTLLSVVLNLQVRLAEVEARLEELGLVAAN